jgi:transposase-like protein
VGKSLGRSPTADELGAAFEHGESVRAIAERFGCTQHTVRNVARRHALSLPPVKRTYRLRVARPSRYPILYQHGWLAERLSAGGSIGSVADEVGCSPTAVRTAIRKLEITDRRRHGEVRFPELHDHDWLRHQYLRGGCSGAEIARRLGASQAAVHRALDAAGVKRRPARKERPSDERLKADWRLFKTVRAVARLNGVGVALAEEWLADVGIFARQNPTIPPRTLRREMQAGRTVHQIATGLGVDPRLVRVELRRLANR